MKSSLLHLLPQVALTCLAFVSWLLGPVMTQQRTLTFPANSWAIKSSPKISKKKKIKLESELLLFKKIWLNWYYYELTVASQISARSLIWGLHVRSRVMTTCESHWGNMQAKEDCVWAMVHINREISIKSLPEIS